MPLSVAAPRPSCVHLAVAGKGTSRTAVSSGDRSTPARHNTLMPEQSENDAPNNSSIIVRCLCIFLAEPLPSNDRGIHVHTQTDGRDL
jgi:hypothetical protein